MLTKIFFALFFLSFPVLILYLTEKNSAAKKVGAAVMCYGTGIILSFLQLVPEEISIVQENIMNITVPLAIPLMLFSTDLKRWSKLAGKTFLSFALIIFSVHIASLIGFMLLKDYIEEAHKVAGMLIGVYSGGTPNMNAIGLALKVKEHILVLTNTADMLIALPWFIFILAASQKVFGMFLPPFSKNQTSQTSDDEIDEVTTREQMDISSYKGIFSKAILLPLFAALGLSILIFAIGAGLFTIAPKQHNMAVLMLTITTLGIVASLIPKVRNIKMSFQLGQYIILIFCLVVGSMADIKQLLTAAPMVVLFVFIVMYGSWLLHLALSAVFRIDTDTVIITSVGAIFSPPFVPVVAAALKNKDVVLSGLAVGILGYGVGNYLGILFAYILARI